MEPKLHQKLKSVGKLHNGAYSPMDRLEITPIRHTTLTDEDRGKINRTLEPSNLPRTCEEVTHFSFKAKLRTLKSRVNTAPDVIPARRCSACMMKPERSSTQENLNSLRSASGRISFRGNPVDSSEIRRSSYDLCGCYTLNLFPMHCAWFPVSRVLHQDSYVRTLLRVFLSMDQTNPERRKVVSLVRVFRWQSARDC